ncbi:hypothetical protein BH11PAT2_BH11PAT2_09080 [soil metagenome]
MPLGSGHLQKYPNPNTETTPLDGKSFTDEQIVNITRLFAAMRRVHTRMAIEGYEFNDSSRAQETPTGSSDTTRTNTSL